MQTLADTLCVHLTRCSACNEHGVIQECRCVFGCDFGCDLDVIGLVLQMEPPPADGERCKCQPEQLCQLLQGTQYSEYHQHNLQMVKTKIDTPIRCLSFTCVCHTVVVSSGPVALCTVCGTWWWCALECSCRSCHGGGPNHYWKTRLKGALSICCMVCCSWVQVDLLYLQYTKELLIISVQSGK